VDKKQYFGYGANRDQKMMEWITGNANLEGKSAVLKDFQLCIQRLDQVPDIVTESSPAPISPRKILENNWGKDFKSYIIKPSTGKEVHGMLWELSALERELVREWELVEYGWYVDIKSEVTIEGSTVLDIETEGLRKGQEVDSEINEKDYETWLNNPETFKRVAEKSRSNYFEREGLSSEGNLASGESKP